MRSSHALITVFFFGSLGLITLIGFNVSSFNENLFRVSEEAVTRTEKFYYMSYYALDDNRPSVFFQAAESIQRNEEGVGLSSNEANGRMDFQYPSGDLYSEAGEPLHFTSRAGEYSRNRQKIWLRDDVFLDYQNMEISSDIGIYQTNKSLYEAFGNVRSEGLDTKTMDKLFVWSESARVNTQTYDGRYEGNVKGKIKRKKVFEESYEFRCDQLVSTYNESKLDLIGDVDVWKEGLRVQSLTGEIYLENYNKKLKYSVFYDDVRVNQQFVDEKGQKIKRKAYSQKMEALMREKKIVMTGAPRVIQGKELIKGSQIILREDIGLIEVDDSSSRIIYGSER